MAAVAETLIAVLVAAVWCGLTVKLAGQMLGGKASK